MLKRYMHKRERYFAMLNDNRVVRPFEWGTEFITDSANGDDDENVLTAMLGSADVTILQKPDRIALVLKGGQIAADRLTRTPR